MTELAEQVSFIRIVNHMGFCDKDDYGLARAATYLPVYYGEATRIQTTNVNTARIHPRACLLGASGGIFRTACMKRRAQRCRQRHSGYLS